MGFRLNCGEVSGFTVCFRAGLSEGSISGLVLQGDFTSGVLGELISFDLLVVKGIYLISSDGSERDTTVECDFHL